MPLQPMRLLDRLSVRRQGSMPKSSSPHIFGQLVRQRSLQVGLLLWILLSVAALALCGGTMPLQIGPHPDAPMAMVISSWIALIFLILEIGLVALITRRRSLAQSRGALPGTGHSPSRDGRPLDLWCCRSVRRTLYRPAPLRRGHCHAPERLTGRSYPHSIAP